MGARAWDLDVGDGVGAALVADQQRVAVREVARARRLAMGLRPCRDRSCPTWPAAMPLAMIFEVVFLPIWSILVPLSACWR